MWLPVVATVFAVGMSGVARAATVTPTLIGSGFTDMSTSAAVGVTTAGAVPAGGSIIVSAYSATVQEGLAPTGASCSDSAGDLYHTDVNFRPNDGRETVVCAADAPAGLPRLSLITVSWTGGIARWDKLVRAFSVNAEVVSDRTAAAFGSGGSPSSGRTATASQADELLFGAIAGFNVPAGTAGFTPGANGTANRCAASGTTSYSSLGGINNDGSPFGPSLFGMYCVVSATGQYAANARLSASAPGGNETSWDAVLATYRLVNGGGPPPWAGGNHVQVRNAASVRCLTPSGVLRIELDDCAHGGPQTWVVKGETIADVAFKSCLSFSGSGGNGSPVVLTLCDPGDSRQQWIATGGEFVNLATERCLDANGPTINQTGTKVQLWDCNGGRNQSWYQVDGNTLPRTSTYQYCGNGTGPPIPAATAYLWNWGNSDLRPCVTATDVWDGVSSAPRSITPPDCSKPGGDALNGLVVDCKVTGTGSDWNGVANEDFARLVVHWDQVTTVSVVLDGTGYECTTTSLEDDVDTMSVYTSPTGHSTVHLSVTSPTGLQQTHECSSS